MGSTLLDTAANPARKPPQRSRLRFTLRLLLAAATVLCIGLGVWTHRAREQQRLVERIIQSGGKVVYHRQPSFGLWTFGKVPVPRVVVEWLGNDYFHDVTEAEIADAALLDELPRLHQLQLLHINSHTLTDDEFAPIARLRHLKAIDIYGDNEDPNTQIGDRSLALLAQLPELELANVESSRITATGLASLAHSKSLEKLYVASPDESMNELAAEPLRQRLSHLSIRRSVAGGFGKIVESWSLRSPPGPRPLAAGK